MEFYIDPGLFLAALTAYAATGVAAYALISTIDEKHVLFLEKSIFLATALVSLYFAVVYTQSMLGYLTGGDTAFTVLRPAAPLLFSLLGLDTILLRSSLTYLKLKRKQEEELEDKYKKLEEKLEHYERRLLTN